MRHLSFLAIAAAAVGGLAVPAAAADPAPKTKKICKAVNNGNPLFPTMKCHTVDVEPAATPTTQVATNGTQPQ